MKEISTTCPKGLKAIIGKMATIMKQNVGMTIHMDMSSTSDGKPFLNIWIMRSEREVCKEFCFWPKGAACYDQNQERWEAMLKLIEEVKQ